MAKESSGINVDNIRVAIEFSRILTRHKNLKYSSKIVLHIENSHNRLALT